MILRFIFAPLFILLSPMLVIIGFVIDWLKGERNVIKGGLAEAKDLIKQLVRFILTGEETT